MEDMSGNKRYWTRQLNKYKVSKEKKTWPEGNINLR